MAIGHLQEWESSMQRRNILALLAGFAIAAPVIGAQQAAVKPAAAPVQKAAKEAPKPAPAVATATAPKPDSAKGMKGMKKRVKKDKKTT